MEFLEKAQKYYEEFKKKAKIKDLKYVAQISISQDEEKPRYAIQFSNISDKLAPVTFIAENPENCYEKVEKFIGDMDYDFVEIKYHEAEAYHASELAKRHLKIVEDIQKRKNEEQAKNVKVKND